jgi:hypothetical protein
MAHRLTIELDRPTFRQLQEQADEDGLSPAECAEGIIQDHLEEDEEDDIRPFGRRR